MNSLLKDDIGPLITAYFRLGIACPFLESESCSIHRDRPLVCREYLVSSPSEHCADPVRGTIERVPLAGGLSRRLAIGPEGRRREVPLLFALDPDSWGDPERGTATGTDLLAEMLGAGPRSVDH